MLSKSDLVVLFSVLFMFIPMFLLPRNSWTDVLVKKLAVLPSESSRLKLKSQHRTRVYVAVTGLWGDYNWNKSRWEYLMQQMDSYRLMVCLGFKLHVALVTYEGLGGAAKLFKKNKLRTVNHGCPMNVLENNFAIKDEVFPLQPLSDENFGTGGTLQFQHRKLFRKYLDLFDLFISQEDDAHIQLHHVLYFLKWTSILKDTSMYPGFGSFERLPCLQSSCKKFRSYLDHLSGEQNKSQNFIDYRSKSFTAFVYKNEIFLRFEEAFMGRMYMIDSNMLQIVLNSNDRWDTEINSVGEFNPFYGSTMWMEHINKIVVPLTEYFRSLVHHVPNKYLQSGVQEEQSQGRIENTFFVPIRDFEMEELLVATRRKMTHGHVIIGQHSSLKIISDEPCYPNQKSFITATKTQIMSVGVNVTIKCL
jgi:hypothetical protein